MKKVGFIDYFLDEWHANNYPKFFSERSGGRYEVAYAWAKIDSPNGGLTSVQWAQKYGVQLLSTMEEVIEKSDVLVVLSPNNPEMHEELCALPLKSGKPVYVDKTFAADKQAAERIFAGVENGTVCFSSSALRFAEEYQDIDKSKITRIYSEGPGVYEIYSIHQIEPIVSLMGTRASRVMFTGDAVHPSMIIEFSDGRYAEMHQCGGADFRITAVDEKNASQARVAKADYFARFIDAVIAFYDTGIVPVPAEQTIDIIAIREAGLRAMQAPFTWITL